MNILKIEQKRNNFFLSLSNGDTYDIPLELLYSHKLEVGKEIEEEKLSTILKEAEEKNCFDSLLKIIRSKSSSSSQIKDNLLKKGFSKQIVENTLLKANEYNLINDKEYAYNLISSLQARGYGKRKIIFTLKNKNIPVEVIDKFESEFSNDQEKEEAIVVFKKRIKLLSGKNIDPKKTKEKIYRYMLSKGFSYDIVSSVMSDYT